MQFIEIAHQLWITLYAAVFGCAFAAAYDILRIIRMLVGSTPVKSGKIKLFKKLPVHGKNGRGFIAGLSAGLRDILFIQTADILYGLFLSSSFCIFLFYFNNGRFRWYLLFAAAFGFMAYYFSVGKLTVYLSGYIISIIKTVFGFIVYVISIPIIWITKLIKKLLRPITAVVLQKVAVYRTEKARKRLRRIVAFKNS